MTIKDIIDISYIAIVIVFTIVVMYWLRSYANRNSDRHLVYLIREKFKKFRDGTTEMQSLTPEDIVIKSVEIKDKTRGDITAEIKYKQNGTSITKTFVYKIKTLCGGSDSFCISP